jgi:hypothetical protein
LHIPDIGGPRPPSFIADYTAGGESPPHFHGGRRMLHFDADTKNAAGEKRLSFLVVLGLNINLSNWTFHYVQQPAKERLRE